MASKDSHTPKSNNRAGKRTNPAVSLLIVVAIIAAAFISSGSSSSISQLVYLLIAGSGLAVLIYMQNQNDKYQRSGRILKGQRSYIGRLNLKRDKYLLSSIVYLQPSAEDQIIPEHIGPGIIRQAHHWRIYDNGLLQSNDVADQPLVGQTVYEARLSKSLPHLVLDNRKSGHSFQRIYLEAQRVNLDGQFDRYFNSYCPQHYQIDSLSFMTPEVLTDMLDLKGCDFEIIDDHLIVCRSPVPNSELDEFQTKCHRLHDRLNDNLSSYRDSYLGPAKVSQFASRLHLSPTGYIAVVIFFGFLTLLLSPVLFMGSEEYDNLLHRIIYILVFGLFLLGFIYFLSKFRAIGRTNKRLLAEFESQHLTKSKKD